MGPSQPWCKYSGFGLSCNKNQTFLRLRNAGQFIVTHIDYHRQWIYLNDPGQCLAARIMNNIYFSDLPFEPVYTKIFTFFNCSSDMSQYTSYSVRRIPCVNKYNSNYTVVVSEDDYVPFRCEKNWSVSVPVDKFVYRYDLWVDLTQDIMLTWRDPACGACEDEGGICGFKGDSSCKIKCYGVQNIGLSRNTKYGLALGLGVPGLICLIGLICYTNRKHQAQSPLQNTGQDATSPSITSQRAHLFTGLDGPTINSYPKTILGDSGRLPKPNDTTCSICLAEYLPKETLRIIPECNHYFHADCIDEWLKMNSTCPLCRNTPNGSSGTTPASSLAVLSASSTSSP